MAEPSSEKFQSRKFQAPKGTRDFYPADLAVRRHIENVWRQTSINHGFEEIDGPTFEYLDLYTHKSGPAIASELFQVLSGKDEEQVAAMKAGAAAPYALRPEFTPTLARMVAARAPELSRPIKWFAIPSHFRAESPQRGRLREFMQWNVDFIGDDSPRADAEVIATAVRALQRLGLDSNTVRVRISDRAVVAGLLTFAGVEPENHDTAMQLADSNDKWTAEQNALAQRIKFNSELFRDMSNEISSEFNAGGFGTTVGMEFTTQGFRVLLHDLAELKNHLEPYGVVDWCHLNLDVVRGLAYYTGIVFEIHEASGAERAIAGGGRYDKLIESFGGPSLPACGFGMGDVVLANILKDKGLLKPAEEYLPRPDAFVIAANDEAAAKVPSLVADLRTRGGLHVRQSYKTTRNVGKLLGDAGKCRARYAVILGKELADTPPAVAVKDMDAGDQDMIALTGDNPHAALIARLRGGNSPSL